MENRQALRSTQDVLIVASKVRKNGQNGHLDLIKPCCRVEESDGVAAVVSNCDKRDPVKICTFSYGEGLSGGGLDHGPVCPKSRTVLEHVVYTAERA